MAIGSLQEIVFQTPTPSALARFWQGVIGGDVDDDDDDFASLENDDVYMVFLHAPDRPSGKSGMRLSIEVDDVPTATEHAEDLGAQKQGALIEDDDGTIQRMLDPGGNPFALISG